MGGIVSKDPREPITEEMWRALSEAYPSGERLTAAWRLAGDLDTLADLLAGRPVSSERLDPTAVGPARRRTLVTLSAPAELLNLTGAEAMSDGPELHFTVLEEFAAIDEPGADPLVSVTGGGVLIPTHGNVIIYGSGGAGKTTLVLDLVFALAAGEPWLGFVQAARPIQTAIVENEGPRPEFRRKLRAKLEATGATLEGRVVILDEPWGELTLSDEPHRLALARALIKYETDLLILGPLVSAGEFPEGGTPHEVRRFERHVADLRRFVNQPFGMLLVHHENRAGQVSGAWERFPDTLARVSAQGNGRTRIIWQKARWASSLHGKTMHLLWAEGEAYVLDDKPEVTEDTIRADLVTAIRKRGGLTWSKLLSLKIEGRRVVSGRAERLAAIRDQLLVEGVIVNDASRKDQFVLWHIDDGACPHPGSRTGSDQTIPFSPADEAGPIRSPVPSTRGNGVGNGSAQPEPALDEELDWQ